MSENQRTSSARQRFPSGRTNASTIMGLRRPRTADLATIDQESSNKTSVILTDEHCKKINDPLHVFNAHVHEYRKPPIVLGPQFPTLPQFENLSPLARPLTCTQEWIRKNQERDWYETADQTLIVHPEEKFKVTKDFVERNRDRLWKFDVDFLKKTPRRVCTDIVEDPFFISKIERYHVREKIINLSTSEKTAKCMKDSHLKFTQKPLQDPYLGSVETSRDARRTKIEKLLLPSAQQYQRTFNRGYVHDVEFKNFSGYNTVLKNNKGAILKR